MPFHLPTSNKGNPRALPTRAVAGKTVLNKTASVKSSTTFGLGPGQWKVRDEKHASVLLNNLRLLREKRDFTDMTFSCDKEMIDANRVVLAAVSPVMRNVFAKHENLMNAEILPPEALHQLVLFIYNASTEVKLDVIKKIEKASRVLQIHPVTTMCSNLLASMPEITVKHLLEDETTATKRRKPIPQRQRRSESMSVHDVAQHFQQFSNENKSLASDSAEGTGITAADISDILMDNKRRGNRASIRLTFHSRSGTPLSRSTEDLSQANDGSSSDTLDTESVDSKEKSNEDSDSSHDVNKAESGVSNGQAKPTKPADEKRKQFALSRLSISSLKNSKTDLSSTKCKPAIPLSKLLQESQLTGSNTDLANLQSPLNSLNNLTWPKRGGGSPKRKELPSQWRKSTTSSEVVNTRRNSSLEGKKTPRTHCTQDKFIIGFKTNSIPNLLKGLNSLREQNLFCDLTIVVGNSKLPCHKVVLAASSDIFCAILKRITTKEIKLTKIDESAIQEMIKFIYTGQCSIDKDNVMGVLRGARRFQLHFIARKCASYLDQYVTSSQSFLSIDNVLVTYKAAGEYGFPKLREESKKFAASKFGELIETQCFKDLSSSELISLLSNEALLHGSRRDSEKEIQLFTGLLRWLHHAPQTRVPHMTTRIMRFVDFSNMTSLALSRVVLKETTIMQDAEMREKVLQVFRYNSSRRSKSEQLARSPLSDSSVNSGGPFDNVLAIALENDPATQEPINRIYKFNPASGWTQLPPMKTPRSHFSLVALDGAIYAIGGLSENAEAQYIATDSCEKLDLESKNQKWKMTSWLLPGLSYSHASTCIVSHKNTNKNDGKKKSPSSPVRKRGNRLSAAFTDGKPLLLSRGSPKQTLGKNKKQAQTTNPIHQAETNKLIFVCGGKANPRQNIAIQIPDGSKFIEKASLPCPCTKLSMTSYCSSIYIACDDVMETSQFRVFEYTLEGDQWIELKVPVMMDKHLLCSGIHVLSTHEEQPHQATISCTSISSGLFLAIGVRDVIGTGRLDFASSNWTSYEQTKLKSPASDFLLCTV